MGTGYYLHISYSQSVKSEHPPSFVSPLCPTAVNSTIQARLGP